jgi:hypothetical protein
MTEFEQWRPIEWTDGWYDVSSLGRVRSWRMRGRNTRAAEPHLMKLPICKRGYRVVRIRVGRDGLHYVHRIVCEAFHGAPPPGRNDCRHLDGDELNNLPENLSWGSRLENMMDMKSHGRHNHGQRHSQAKLRDVDVREIRRLYAAGEMNMPEIGRRFGVTDGHVCNIVNRKAWSHLDPVAS